jgi:hypothetical protein
MSHDLKAHCLAALSQIHKALDDVHHKYQTGKINSSYLELFGPLAAHQLQVMKILAAIESGRDASWESLVDQDKI